MSRLRRGLYVCAAACAFLVPAGTALPAGPAPHEWRTTVGLRADETLSLGARGYEERALATLAATPQTGLDRASLDALATSVAQTFVDGARPTDVALANEHFAALDAVVKRLQTSLAEAPPVALADETAVAYASALGDFLVAGREIAFIAVQDVAVTLREPFDGRAYTQPSLVHDHARAAHELTLARAAYGLAQAALRKGLVQPTLEHQEQALVRARAALTALGVAYDSDADGDGVAAIVELRVGASPLVADTDGDGLVDGFEALRAMPVHLPASTDTDGNGMADGIEDADGDGLAATDEQARGTDPLRSDSDGDGLADGRELALGTNPLALDTDGDGLADGAEPPLGLDPAKADTDGDGVPDGRDTVEASVAGPDGIRATVTGTGDVARAVEIQSLRDDAAPASPGQVGAAFDITLDPSGGAVLESATLAVPYDAAAVPDPSKLRLYYFDPAAARWVSASDEQTVDRDAHVVRARVSHFSVYGLFDGDAVSDFWETQTDPCAAVAPVDSDGDGLADCDEREGMLTGFGDRITTDPADPDTDDDGLTDGEEMGEVRSVGSEAAPSAPLASGAYAGEVLADEPVVYWRLNEAAGPTVNDSSGDNRSGRYVGGVTFGDQGATGDGDGAVSFDGASGRITAPLVTAKAAGVTLEAWVKLRGTVGRSLVLYNGHSGFNGYGIMVSAGGAGGAFACGFGDSAFVLVGGVSCDGAHGAVALTRGTWVHVVATLSAGGVWTLYGNGAARASAATPLNPPASGGTAVGKEFDGVGGSVYLAASVDEVAIYDRALTADRVLAHYRAASAAPPAQGYRFFASAATESCRLDPRDVDTDHDGLTDADEYDEDTNPCWKNTDGDTWRADTNTVAFAFRDGTELDYGSDPTVQDTDGDGIADGHEVLFEDEGLNANRPDHPLTPSDYAQEFGRGAACGEACTGNTVAWLLGNLSSGALSVIPGPGWIVGAIADLRDAIALTVKGQLVGAGFSLVGVIPYGGDAAKITRKTVDFAADNPQLADEVLQGIAKIDDLPKSVRVRVLAAVEGGAWTRLKSSGFSDDDLLRLARGRANFDELAHAAEHAAGLPRAHRSIRGWRDGERYLRENELGLPADHRPAALHARDRGDNRRLDIRHPDARVGNTLHEVKTGYMSCRGRTKRRILRQIEKDRAIRSNRVTNVDTVVWHFVFNERDSSLGLCSEIVDALASPPAIPYRLYLPA